MSKKKSNKELVNSLDKKGFFMTPEDYKEALGLLSHSEKIERMQTNLAKIYKEQLKKSS